LQIGVGRTVPLTLQREETFEIGSHRGLATAWAFRAAEKGGCTTASVRRVRKQL
jgi:hypothetical protein